MKSLLIALGVLQPQLMEVATQNDGTNTKKLIMIGLFVAFVVIFIFASKKMKKKK